MAVRFINEEYGTSDRNDAFDRSDTFYRSEGLCLGYGVFETIDVKAGRPVSLDRHLERLTKASASIGLGAIQKENIREKLDPWYAGVSGGLGAASDGQALKIVVFKDGEDTCILFMERNNPYDLDGGRQLSICASASHRDSTSLTVGIKSTSYLDNILERNRAKSLGFDECYLLNQEGYLAEGSHTNIFMVHDGVIVTPHESCGLLKGIARQRILEGAAARGVQILEEPELTKEMLHSSSGIVLTNALMGVRAVGRCDDRTLTGSGDLERLLAEIMENDQ